MRKEKNWGKAWSKKKCRRKKTQQKSGERKKRIYIKQPQTHTNNQTTEYFLHIHLLSNIILSTVTV